MPKEETYLTITGEIRYNMTNDYMFRVILQENEKVLRGLVSFLFYLCRALTRLLKGEDYSKLQPVTLIGFLDFTLFPKHPEFYATYKLLNTKDYHLYSGKLALGVVNLNRTDLATDEDKTYGIDNWVRIFKAKTWEELRMLSENNEYVEEMVRSLYKFNSDEQIREQCEEIEIEFAACKARYREQEEATAKLKAELAEALAEKEAVLAEKADALAELARLKALLQKHNIQS